MPSTSVVRVTVGPRSETLLLNLASSMVPEAKNEVAESPLVATIDPLPDVVRVAPVPTVIVAVVFVPVVILVKTKEPLALPSPNDTHPEPLY
jgi:hypothetical protein